MGDRRGGSTGFWVRHTQQHQHAVGLYPFFAWAGTLKSYLSFTERTRLPPEHEDTGARV